MKYYFGGVNGSGKTTLLKKIAELKPEYSIYSGAKQLMESLGIPGNYEALRAMDHAKSTAAFGELVEAELKKPGDELIDGHYLNMKWGELYPVGGSWLKKVDALILVTAPTDTIFERILADSERDRALFPADTTSGEEYKLLEEFVSETELVFETLQRATKLPYLVINNVDIDDAAKEFIAFDNKLRTK